MLLDVARNAARLHGALPPLIELERLGIPMETIVRVLGDVGDRRNDVEFLPIMLGVGRAAPD